MQSRSNDAALLCTSASTFQLVVFGTTLYFAHSLHLHRVMLSESSFWRFDSCHPIFTSYFVVKTPSRGICVQSAHKTAYSEYFLCHGIMMDNIIILNLPVQSTTGAPTRLYIAMWNKKKSTGERAHHALPSNAWLICNSSFAIWCWNDHMFCCYLYLLNALNTTTLSAIWCILSCHFQYIFQKVIYIVKWHQFSYDSVIVLLEIDQTVLWSVLYTLVGTWTKLIVGLAIYICFQN